MIIRFPKTVEIALRRVHHGAKCCPYSKKLVHKTYVMNTYVYAINYIN